MALWTSSFNLLPFVGDSGVDPSTRSQAVPSCRCALKSSTQFSETEMAKVGRIKLGSQGLEISAQGLGCMGMVPVYDARKPEPDMIALIRHAIQNGVTFLDTADVFGLYTNEILLGKALKGGLRDKVELGSKFGLWVADGKVGIRGDPEYVRSACEASLKRLEIDCIDLYYVIRIDTRVPIEVTLRLGYKIDRCRIIHLSSILDQNLNEHGHALIVTDATLINGTDNWSVTDMHPFQHVHGIAVRERKIGELRKLVEEGKIKYIGLSEASASTIRRAHAVHPLSAVQLEWSLWTRDAEKEIIPTCRELGIGIVAYCPLGRGFLASGPKVVESFTENDFRKLVPRFHPENLEHNNIIFEKVSKMAKSKGCTPGQLALAWLHHQGNDVCPIPGTTNIDHLNQNIGALSLKLTPEEMAELESFVAGDVVRGERSRPGLATYKVSDTPPLSSWKAS